MLNTLGLIGAVLIAVSFAVSFVVVCIGGPLMLLVGAVQSAVGWWRQHREQGKEVRRLKDRLAELGDGDHPES